MNDKSGMDWLMAALVALFVLVTVVATFRFGDRGDQMNAVMAAIVFLIGTAGVYRLTK